MPAVQVTGLFSTSLFPRLAALLGVCLAASLAAGCGSCGSEKKVAGKDGDAGAAATASSFKTITMQAESSGRSGAAANMPPVPRVESLRLLDAGKGRRQSLRYALDEQPRAFVITVRLETRRMAAGDWEPRVTLPEIGYGLAVTPGADGALSLRGLAARVAESTAKGKDGEGAARATSDFLGRYRANLEGRLATATVDERGLLDQVTPVDDAAGKGPAAPEMRHEVEQLLLESVVPFPEEPVGKGARWEVITVLRRGAGVVKQVATYELLEAQKDRLRVAARLVQNGEHQVVNPAGLPAGTVAEILALVWRASGELVVSPASVTPLSGTLDVEYRVHGRVERGLLRNEYFVESAGKVTLATEPAADATEEAGSEAAPGAP